MRDTDTNSTTVVLVAHEPDGTEHLGIRYVASALKAAGFTPQILPLVSFDAIARACAESAAAKPMLVGLSITDAWVAPLLLAFARCLRQAGYVGHLTAGGALATVLRQELLAEQPALDSIIRHDGERAVCVLARAIAQGLPLNEVPGLTTRISDGQPNPRLPLSATARPLRKRERARVFGLACADVSASRGCTGTCAYCGVAALERDARAEASALTCPTSAPRLIHGARRRSAEDVALEVAELQHDHDVRVVRLVDDNLLGPEPKSALRWISDLRRGLDVRATKPLAWRMMVEPRVVNRDVARALADLGVVQVLVGLESLTSEGLHALGRGGTPERNLSALACLIDAGIAPYVNVLALRPGGSVAQASAEIEALSAIENVAWDVLPVMVNPGTDLAHDLELRGELAGRGFGMAWQPADRAIERALYAVEHLRVGGLAWLAQERSLPDIDFALRAALRCGVRGTSSALIERTGDLLRLAQRERRRALTLALAVATDDLDDREFGQTVAAIMTELKARLRPLDHRVLALLEETQSIHASLDLSRSSFLRSNSSLLAATLFVALSSGCEGNGRKTSPKDAGPSGSNPDFAAMVDTWHASASDADESGQTDAAVLPPQPDVLPTPTHDAGVYETETAASDVLATQAEAGSDVQCDTDALWFAVAEHEGVGPCLPLPSPQPAGTPTIFLDADGRVVDNTGISDPTAKKAWLDAVASSRWPCLAGQTIQYQCLVLLIL